METYKVQYEIPLWNPFSVNLETYNLEYENSLRICAEKSEDFRGLLWEIVGNIIRFFDLMSC